MRADRLLSLLLLLQVNRRVTAKELARRLEVSERTIHRDMEALSMSGVPVFAERGIGGGWALAEAYRTNLTGLNTAEIQSLFVSTPPRLLSDLGLQKAAEGALIKLLAAIPSMSRRSAEYARQRIHIDVTGWRQSTEDISALGILQEAIWQEKKLRFFYDRASCEPVERVIDPLGLVAKGSVWYFVGAVNSDVRTYRVSRIQSAELLQEHSARLQGFDLAAYWQKSAADFKASLPRYQATVRAAPEIVPWLSTVRYGRVESMSAPDERGWVELSMVFDAIEAAQQFALSFGANIEVVEPAELRELVVRSAAETVAMYAAVVG
jgi:predicted DNA-binding transcriptional regulator YafY